MPKTNEQLRIAVAERFPDAVVLDADGELVPVNALARRFRKDPATIWRWRERGVLIHGSGGQRAKLRMVRVGGRWYVRPADLEAFFRAAAGNDQPDANVAEAIAVASERPDRADRELRQRATAAGEALRRLAPGRGNKTDAVV